MTDTQKKNINAEEIGYMSYNKLNVFMTILLLGFSITFAILGDRVNLGPNSLIGVGIYAGVVVVGALGVMLYQEKISNKTVTERINK